MARPFAELRKLMSANDMNQEQLARRIGLSTSCMNDRLNGRFPFTLREAYEIVALFEQPLERLHELFPPGGRLPPGAVAREEKASRERVVTDLLTQLISTVQQMA